MNRFLTVCLNPTFQRTVTLENLRPGEVNRALESRFDISGKGINVTRVLTQLGAEVRHITHLGGKREEFLALCAEDRLDVVWAPTEVSPRTCTTLLAHGSITEIVEQSDPVTPKTEKAVLELYHRELEEAGVIILSGTKADGYSSGLFPHLVKSAKAEKKHVILDCRGEDLIRCLPHRPDLIKINLFEFAATFFPEMRMTEGMDDSGIRGVIEERMRVLSLGGTAVVVTRGTRGVLYAENGRLGETAPRPVDPVVNSIGCGDAFTAAAALVLSEGGSLEKAVEQGVKYGAANAALIRPGVIV